VFLFFKTIRKIKIIGYYPKFVEKGFLRSSFKEAGTLMKVISNTNLVVLLFSNKSRQPKLKL
jgi:hypothetical protein